MSKLPGRGRTSPLGSAPRQATIDYFGMFMGLKCAPQILASRVYPNPKELTESFACYNAVFQHLRIQ